jgi:hypothetical protein
MAMYMLLYQNVILYSLKFIMIQMCLESELAKTSIRKLPMVILQHDSIIQ